MTDDREPFREARAVGKATSQRRRLENAALRAEWRAQVDDTIGGWCITDASIPGTPADGNPPIAHFIHERVALHIAGIHNDWLADLTTDAPDATSGRTDPGERCSCPPHIDGVGREKWPDCPVHTLREMP